MRRTVLCADTQGRLALSKTSQGNVVELPAEPPLPPAEPPLLPPPGMTETLPLVEPALPAAPSMPSAA
jgi:hypothetical protein